MGSRRPSALSLDRGTRLSSALADPDLGAGLDERSLRRAEQECIASEVTVGAGPWRPEDAEGEAARGGIGLLVLEGLVVRRAGADGRYGAELLGPGDLLRPWEHDGEDTTLPSRRTSA